MLTLYHCAGSRGLRPLWTMAEMGMACDVKLLPFPPRMKATEYLDVNPLGTVPMLVDGNVRMTESAGIAEYLVTRYGPTPLAVTPDEPDYGHFIDFLHHADATLTFPQTVFIRFCKFEKSLGQERAGEAYAEWFIARLVKLEERLKNREYLCADRFTAADIAVGYAIYLARMIGLSERMPIRVNAYLDRLIARDGFRKALEMEGTLR
jgi:glutathione S-transferase